MDPVVMAWYCVFIFYTTLFLYAIFRISLDRNRPKGRMLYFTPPRHRHPENIRRGRNEEINLLNYEEYIKQISQGD